MDNEEQKCPECGKPLGPSQYARSLNPDGSAINAVENLVCRNFPHCKIAQVEPRSGSCRCDDPQCAKCLLTGCQDDNCITHPKVVKEQFRIKYKNR